MPVVETKQTAVRCFACGKKLQERRGQAITSDGAQVVLVGVDCATKISRSGFDGYQPPKGGPRLYVLGKQPTANDGANLVSLLG